jgi:hypothetical protein
MASRIVVRATNKREGRSVMSQESRSSNQQHRVREADEDKTMRMRAEEFSAHDTVPEQAGVYFAPRPVPMVSKHRTIETARVRLSPEVDPKRARTQRLALPQVPHRGRALGFAGLFTVLILGGTVLVTHFVEPTEAEPSSAPRAALTVATQTAPVAKDPVSVTVRAARPNVVAPSESPATERAEEATPAEQAAAAKRSRRPSKDLWLE